MTQAAAEGAWTAPGEWEPGKNVTSRMGSNSTRNLSCAHY